MELQVRTEPRSASCPRDRLARVGDPGSESGRCDDHRLHCASRPQLRKPCEATAVRRAQVTLVSDLLGDVGRGVTDETDPPNVRNRVHKTAKDRRIDTHRTGPQNTGRSVRQTDWPGDESPYKYATSVARERLRCIESFKRLVRQDQRGTQDALARGIEGGVDRATSGLTTWQLGGGTPQQVAGERCVRPLCLEHLGQHLVGHEHSM